MKLDLKIRPYEGHVSYAPKVNAEGFDDNDLEKYRLPELTEDEHHIPLRLLVAVADPMLESMKVEGYSHGNATCIGAQIGAQDKVTFNFYRNLPEDGGQYELSLYYFRDGEMVIHDYTRRELQHIRGNSFEELLAGVRSNIAEAKRA